MASNSITAFTLTIDVASSNDGEVEEVQQLQSSISRAELCDLTPLVAAEHVRLSTHAVMVDRTETCSSTRSTPPSQHLNTDISSPAPLMAAVFTPSTLLESSFEQLQLAMMEDEASLSSSSSCRHAIRWLDRNPQQISQSLLSLIHPFLAENFSIKAIIASATHHRHRAALTSGDRSVPLYHAPSDLVLLDLSHTPLVVVEDLLDNISSNCPTIHSGPESVLKVLLIQRVQFCAKPTTMNPLHGEFSSSSSNNNNKSNGVYKNDNDTIDIPACPVCLHRVDPTHLGLPRPVLCCSKFCPPPDLSSSVRALACCCPRQRLLRPWPPPSACASCRVIERYWQRNGSLNSDHYADNDHGMTILESAPNNTATIIAATTNHLACMACGMKETLWVCLTCGFVGCGRYSSKHAVQHNSDTRHPFCLELSTLRIWSYVDGEFAHRVDLLECPSSPPLLQPWVVMQQRRRSSFAASATNAAMMGDGSDMNQYSSSEIDARSRRNTPYDMTLDDYERMIAANFASVDEKSPKKATMVGEEYEALLQSALEEQAQHYEGEITGLRAQLAAEQVDQNDMTPADAAEIENLKNEISILREKIDRAGRDLLALQAQQAGHRATSQRLLREQRVAQDLLTKIREESAMEHEQGRLQIEELEQQIADLKANQKMMQQFSQNEDLKNSQIFGASEQSPNPKAKKGKSKRRGLFRR